MTSRTGPPESTAAIGGNLEGVSTTAGNTKAYADSSGSFKRRGPRFTDRIVANPSGEGEWPAEPGRYRLVVSLACPWAHRSVIVRRLMGLEDAISLGITDPLQDDRSWRFSLDEGGVDPVLGYTHLEQAYLARDPENGTENGVSVPAIVDVASGELITNDYPQITIDLGQQWRGPPARGRPRPLPRAPPGGDRRGERGRLPRRQQRGLQGRVRHEAGPLRGGLRGAVRPARRARRAPGEPALPRGRPHHRGRRPPVHHARPVRRGLPGPLQVQPAEARRVRRALGLRPRPLPDPRVRRHGRLRPHQAPLLHGPDHDQPDADRPARPGAVGLADHAPPRGARRLAASGPRAPRRSPSTHPLRPLGPIDM